MFRNIWSLLNFFTFTWINKIMHRQWLEQQLTILVYFEKCLFLMMLVVNHQQHLLFFPHLSRFPANTNGVEGKGQFVLWKVLDCNFSKITNPNLLFTEVSHSALESILCQCGGLNTQCPLALQVVLRTSRPGCRWQSRPDRRHLLNSWEDRSQSWPYGMPVILSFVPLCSESQWLQQSLTATSSKVVRSEPIWTLPRYI